MPSGHPGNYTSLTDTTSAARWRGRAKASSLPRARGGAPWGRATDDSRSRHAAPDPCPGCLRCRRVLGEGNPRGRIGRGVSFSRRKTLKRALRLSKASSGRPSSFACDRSYDRTGPGTVAARSHAASRRARLRLRTPARSCDPPNGREREAGSPLPAPGSSRTLIRRTRMWGPAVRTEARGSRIDRTFDLAPGRRSGPERPVLKGRSDSHRNAHAPVTG